MKALILNSGMGKRMGNLTKSAPKCMTEICADETIVSRQLKLLESAGITETVITTGYLSEVLEEYIASVGVDMDISFVYNPLFASTNYIYSIYLAKEVLKDSDILLMHGDLVFDKSVLDDIVSCNGSCMKVSSSLPIPEKDFKAVVRDGYVKAVGVEFFDSAMEAQALYRLEKQDWSVWLENICAHVESGDTNCYAEKALNEITDRVNIRPFDAEDRLCTEIDTPEDLLKVKSSYDIQKI